MKLSHIDKEFNFSDEINQSIETLNVIYKDGIHKVNSLKHLLSELKENNASEDKILKVKEDIQIAKQVAKDKKSEAKEIYAPALKKLKSEYKEFNKEVSSLVKDNLKNIDNKFAEDKKELTAKYEADKDSLLNEKKATNDKVELKNIDEREKGIDIQYKRALKQMKRERFENILEVKKAYSELAYEYAKTEELLLGKNTFLTNLNTSINENKSVFCLEKTLKDRNFWISKISLMCFLALVVIYLLICTIGGSKIQYEKIFTQSAIVMTVALGGVFIYSQKGFDMSLGGAVCLAAIVSSLAWNATSNVFVALLSAIAVGVVVEITNASLANVLKLPVMVATLAMNSVLSSLVTTIMDNQPTQTIVANGVYDLDKFGFYLILVLVFFLICAFVFNKTPMGRRNKMLGCNKTSAVYSGVNATKQGILTFIMAGIAIGFGAVLTMVRSGGTISSGTGSTIGLDVILAVVFGGMQVTGGPKSKISAAVVGGLSTVLITYILIALANVSGIPAIRNYDTFVKGVVFLLIVFVNQIGIKNDRLPAIEMMW